MRILLWSAFIYTFARAAEISIVGQNVTAGKPVEVTVDKATEAGSGYPGKTTTHLQFGITNLVYNFWMCSLTSFVPAHDGKYELTVPPEMGPSGLYYKISYQGFENPENGTVGDSIIGFDGTDYFFLSGGKGHWTPADAADELHYNGLVGFANADIPCSSYPCAQACAMKQFPTESEWRNDTVWLECLKTCKGVALNYASMAEFTAASTTVSLPSSLPTPTSSCKEEEYHTPCGTDCCSRYEYCSELKRCVDLPLHFASLASKTATQAGGATRTGGTGAKETAAARVLEVDWMVLGAAAGVFGLTGVAGV